MDGEDVGVRPERTGDEGAVRFVNEAAFGRSDEADLIDRLRGDGAVLVSLVAVQGGRVVGHALFSRMLIEVAEEPVQAVALAPVAVLPANQDRGVGSRLVRVGLDWLRTQHERTVLVLGSAKYYSRFGFSSDRARSLIHPFPPDAFMALELVP